MKPRDREQAEQHIDRRLKRSVRVQRAVAALALLAGGYAATHDEGMNAKWVFAGMGASMAMVTERALAKQSCRNGVLSYWLHCNRKAAGWEEPSMPYERQDSKIEEYASTLVLPLSASYIGSELADRLAMVTQPAELVTPAIGVAIAAASITSNAVSAHNLRDFCFDQLDFIDGTSMPFTDKAAS